MLVDALAEPWQWKAEGVLSVFEADKLRYAIDRGLVRHWRDDAGGPGGPAFATILARRGPDDPRGGLGAVRHPVPRVELENTMSEQMTGSADPGTVDELGVQPVPLAVGAPPQPRSAVSYGSHGYEPADPAGLRNPDLANLPCRHC